MCRRAGVQWDARRLWFSRARLGIDVRADGTMLRGCCGGSAGETLDLGMRLCVQLGNAQMCAASFE